jgi:2-polyprenyl-3-methyl-5-hydroxy-6-metoxy-1,4-benzoquinol methylase
MDAAKPPADPTQVGLASLHLFTHLQGAVTSLLVLVGHRIGLYAGLSRLGGPVTGDELAAATGLHPRWVTEWLRQQAAAGLVAHDDAVERFWLDPAYEAVLAEPGNPSFMVEAFRSLEAMTAAAGRLPDAFRTGIGFGWEAGGEPGAEGTAAMLAGWYRANLVPVLIERLDGVADRLRAGALVADVGCGTGVALRTMAAAYPASRFVGYDLSPTALAIARAEASAAGLDNVDVVDASSTALPDDGRYALVCMFDVLHDTTDPAAMAAAIRRALSPDGTWLLFDVKSRATVAENLEKIPLAALMYGTSVLSCLPAAMSEPGGAGLGTLGLTEAVARGLATGAGFSRFDPIDIAHPVNVAYQVRP